MEKLALEGVRRYSEELRRRRPLRVITGASSSAVDQIVTK